MKMKCVKMRRIIVCIMILNFVIATLIGCGNKKKDVIEGTPTELLAKLYETADLSEDFKSRLDYFETYEMTKEIEMSILGTEDIAYVEGACSIPMMQPNAFQMVLLRVSDSDVETVKEKLTESADLDKWICVSAETMLIESRGDLILFVMGDQESVYALNSAFQNL